MQFSEVHERIEKTFSAWGRTLFRWRWTILVGSTAVTLGFGSLVPQLRSDNSVESYVQPDDPARLAYDRFREQFGQDNVLVVLVRSPEVFDLAFLERLREFHRAIEDEVPYVDEVTSLLNARSTRGEGDRLVVEDLLEEWPTSDAALAALEVRVFETPSYVNTLVDGDATVTTVTVKQFLYSTRESEADVLAGFSETSAGGVEASLDRPRYLTREEEEELVEAMLEILARFDAPDFELHLSGEIVSNYNVTRYMLRDTQLTMSLSIVTIAILLFVVFRRLSACLLPLAVVVMALVTTTGIQVLLGIAASMSSEILPPLLLAVGICGAVHVITPVYSALGAGMGREDAIAHAMGHSGLAVVMASLTTAVGLVSFSGAELAQIADLGTIAPVGVLVVLLYVLILLPAVLAIVPLRARAGGEALRNALNSGVARIGEASVRHPRRVLVGTAIVVLVASVGVYQLRFGQFVIKWFPEDDPTRVAAELADLELGGARTMEIVVDTGRENGLGDPDLLSRLQDAVNEAEAYDDGVIHVVKVLSVLDIVKETHKALNGNQHAYYAIPRDRRLLAQELLLFENTGFDELEKFADSDLSTARLSFRLPLVDDLYMPGFLETLERMFARHLGDDVGIETTGMGMLFARAFSVINVSMGRSYAIALVIITLLLIVVVGDLRRGLVAMIPNLLPVYLTMGLMGALDIPLDGSTLVIGCIIIGLAVDDTIHFMHRFQRDFSSTRDVARAVRLTLLTTGSAMLFTSVVLACGFGVILSAYMVILHYVALLASFAISVAFLADIVVGPALMAILTPETGGLTVVSEPLGASGLDSPVARS